jgi:lipoyl(octanoyl) transferase
MSITIKNLGKVDYQSCWTLMRDFTEARDHLTTDELWLVEHAPVFTLGLAGKEEHLLQHNHQIPLIRTDRGGQITYHGPGQIIIYVLCDLTRLQLGVRNFVTSLEQGIINFLARYRINAYGDRAAPGVYCYGKKIASLGLKIRKGCSYHGISFNFNLDKKPFSYINPCGYAGLEVINFNELLPISVLDFYSAQMELAVCLQQAIYLAASQA